MPVTINVNGLTLVHKGSNGIAMATVPDVCKTPSPSGPLPMPYPNMAMSTDLILGTMTVKADGMMAAHQSSKFMKSTGDEPGVAGGLMSMVFIGEASFVSFSPTVMMNGKPVCRLTDKMLMNKGNTVCMAGVLQAPLPPSTPLMTMAPPPDPKFCTVSAFEVECKHKGTRKFHLDGVKDPGAFIKVIASDAAPEKMGLKVKGKCGYGSPKCPAPVLLKLDGTEVMPPGTTSVELQLPESGRIKGRDPFWLVNAILFPSRIGSDIYSVQVRTCGGGKPVPVAWGAYVEVFPNFGWSGTVSAGYEQGKLPTDTRGTDYDVKGNFVFEGALTAQLGSSAVNWKPLKSEYGHDTSDADPLSQHLFKGLRAFSGQIARFFDSLQQFGVPGKFNPRWPKVSLSGGVDLAEIEGKHDVGPKGKLEFKLDPLIGAEISTDILEWFIHLAGAAAGPPGIAVAKFLNVVKKKAGKGVALVGDTFKGKAVLEIVLTVGGDIGGVLSWKWIEGKCQHDEAKIEAGVDFSIVGRATAEAKVWRVIATAGATFEVKSADGKSPVRISVALQPKSNARNIQLEGKAEFNGLAFYYLLYTDVGVGEAEAATPKTPPQDPGAYSSDKMASRKDMSTKCLCTLLDAKQWPAEKSSEGGKALQ